MLYSRQVLAKISPFLTKNLIILLVGSRQVGKTSIMKLIENELIRDKIVEPKQIVSFDLESINDLETIQNQNYQQFVEYLYAKTGLLPNKELYVFIDEIQYLKNSSSFFKLIVDHYPNIHLILSGSSSLEIKKIFTERLTGRKVLFHIKALSFPEYLTFRQHKLTHLFNKISSAHILAGDFTHLEPAYKFIKELLPSYEDFVIFGSYPRPSLETSMDIREKFLQEIRDTYVRKDISDILRVENLSGFNRLLQLLATQSGNLVNLQELSNTSTLNRDSLEKYLFLMQETYILSLLQPYFSNPRQEIIKMPKVYLSDTGIRNILLNNLQPLDERVDKGALVENCLFNQLEYFELPIKFWRTKTKVEVDFILTTKQGQLLPLEVKYQSFKKPLVPSGLKSFIERYQPPTAIIATKDYLAKTKFKNTNVFFIPCLFF